MLRVDPQIRRDYVETILDDHEEALIAGIRATAEDRLADASDDDRDLAVALAATMLRPPPELSHIGLSDAQVKTWFGAAEVTDAEVAGGRALATEHQRRYAAEQQAKLS